MCGRWTLTVEKDVLEGFFDARYPSKPYKPRYNIAPDQSVPIITNSNPHEFTIAKWGLVPSWSDGKAEYSTINARAETIEEKPAYKKPFMSQRCLVPADGFYEWKKSSGNIPYRCVLKSGDLFAFAGLYDIWKDSISFSIVTVPPNATIARIHSRMPAILRVQDYEKWLKKPDKSVLVPYEGEMDTYRVSRLVNNPKNDYPKILQDVGTESLEAFF